MYTFYAAKNLQEQLSRGQPLLSRTAQIGDPKTINVTHCTSSPPVSGISAHPHTDAACCTTFAGIDRIFETHPSRPDEPAGAFQTADSSPTLLGLPPLKHRHDAGYA